ncbi:MAG TPA: dihydrolipoamide acetyltransferase family protein [Dongiaceae bacterium]|nr:dihydrolipoamide acetyltransferase family protein [Dongiaceae bacterium]
MDFLVPKLSATMESATVLRWHKKAGERVRMGEPLVEIETDKAAIEVEAPADGTLETILAPEGTQLPIGGALGRLAAGGAGGPAARPAPAPAAAAETAAPTAAPAPPAAAPARPAAAARIAASPLARRLAAEAGIDLKRLTGTGPAGRIRKRDVLAARAPSTPERAQPQSRPAASGTLSPMRLRIAEAVALSRRTIPAFALDRWVETGELHRARRELGPRIERDTGVKVTLTDLLLQAMADTLAGQPAILDRWIEDGGRPQSVSPAAIDIGLVVAVEGGMMIPVLTDLGRRSLAEIARARRDAIQRVRTGRLIAADAAPASISLSNLGRSGIDRFEAIIHPGQSSILAVGREHERVIARGGAPAVARGMNLTFSVDHRLIDGVRGAAFLSALADRIEFGPWT